MRQVRHTKNYNFFSDSHEYSNFIIEWRFLSPPSKTRDYSDYLCMAPARGEKGEFTDV